MIPLPSEPRDAALRPRWVRVELPDGIHWLERRGEKFASLEDLLSAIEVIRGASISLGNDTHALDVFRSALCESAARAR